MSNKVKTIILVVVGILLLAFFIWKLSNITVEEKYFKPITFKNQNKIESSVGMSYVDTILLVGLDKLDISNTTILLRPLTAEMKQQLGPDLQLRAHIRYYGNGFIIWTDKMSREEAITVFSHELIHLKQYEDRRIVVEGSKVFWLGEEVSLADVPYEYRPWEVEAFQQQNEMQSYILSTVY